MVRVRNLVLAIAAATALTTEVAHALGLGEVRLQSSLNQPLVAEIELLDAKKLAPGEVVPSLASVEEFNRAGIDRQYFLTDLKFTPVVRPDGKSVIQISSSKPVREPYLNFLVEVLWPSGRLLREYTLLLDPPLYSPETVAAVAPQLPITVPAPPPVARRSVTPAASSSQLKPSLPSAPAPAPAPAPSALSGSEYRTSSRDTLWEIAEKSPHAGSVHQTMLAIQDLNPDAFISGNINRMKSGQVLRMPDANQINTRTPAEAIAQVAQQNTSWRQARTTAGDGSRQVDATRRTKAGDAPTRSESGDNLRLVAPETGKSSAGSDTGVGANGKALRDKLATTQESLDSSRRENVDLKERLDDLQGQLEKLQRLMQLKDDQLAKLQAELASDSTDRTGTDTAPTADSVDQAKTSDLVGAQPTPADSATERAAPQPQAAKPVVKPAAAPKPVVSEPASPPAEPSLLDEYLGNPLLLGVLGGSALLLLLVGLMALSRRNAMKEAELQEQLLSEHETNSFNLNADIPTDRYDREAPLQTVSPVFADEQPAQTVASTGDAIAEADIYIAYGRFNQAAELLQNALNDEPQRSDLRLKLMEVYAELGDRDGFSRQETELREIGGAGSGIDQLKLKYPAMAAIAAVSAMHTSVDDFDLDALQFEEHAAASAAGQDLDDAFDLSLDDLDIDLDENRPNEALPSSDTPSGLDDSLDFDSIALGDLESDGHANSHQADDFSFDLAEPSAPGSVSNDALFSFDLDADSSDAPVSSSVNNDFGFDLDLSEVDSAPSEDEKKESEPFLPIDADLSVDQPVDNFMEENFADHLDQVQSQPAVANIDESAELAPEPSVAGGLTDADEDDFNFFSDTDEATTKLDLARAYIDMGDAEGARDILDEVIMEGSESQQQEAREMLAKLA